MGPAVARLEVVEGKAAGMSILVEQELIIGRHAEGAGQLAQDDEISRTHARIAWQLDGSCTIEDLGSTNGTFVNGLRVSLPQVLREGDAIEIGATTLVVRELPRPEPEPPAELDDGIAAPVPADEDAGRPQATLLSNAGWFSPALGEETPSAATDPADGREKPGPEHGGPGHGGAQDASRALRTEDVSTVSQELPVAEAASTPADAGEPWPAPVTDESGAPPPLSLQLEVDFAAREARLFLDRNSEPVRLVFDAGAWRLALSAGDP